MSIVFPPSYDSIIDERVFKLMNNWPRVDHASGCIDCGLIFREPELGRKCPGCGSESVFDVAAALRHEDAAGGQEHDREVYIELRRLSSELDRVLNA